MSSRGFIGAGDLYVSRYNFATSQYEPFVGPMEARKFAITPKSELKEMTSKGRETYGNILESVPIPQPFEFSVEFGEVNRDALNIAFFGESTPINTGAGTMTDKPVVAKLGAWVEIGHMNITAAGLTVENAGGTVTYVLGTDYEINYRLGMIRAITGGAITDGATVNVSGSYAAVSGTQIAGGKQSQVRAKFRLDGKNFADGLPVIVDVYEGILAADGEFDFLADDFNTVPLNGRLKTPVGKTEPFVIKMLDNAI